MTDLQACVLTFNKLFYISYLNAILNILSHFYFINLTFILL